MTPTEKFVSELCELAFLPIWSYPSPIGKKGKELCDVLIVCDNDIIIISVKEIIINSKGEYEVDVDRWLKRAIDASVKQIYGAERILAIKNSVLLADRKTEVTLPNKQNRNIYRIAVAFGRGEKFPLKYGDFGKGFVHVFDEHSVQGVLKELDTITDFVDYLKAKEEYILSGVRPLGSSELNLLAYYMFNTCQFPKYEENLIMLDEKLWDDLLSSSEYSTYKKEIRESYIWDTLIQTLCSDLASGNLIKEISREDMEISLRYMAKENRINRQLLSEIYLEFIGYYDTPTSRARIANSLDNKDVVYVFLLEAPHHKTREDRHKELALRCLVARMINKDKKRVIGIATEKYSPKGFSLDINYLYLEELTPEIHSKAVRIQQDLGYFRNPNWRNL